MVSRNTTLVTSLGLRIGPACEAGLSAGMRKERVSPQIRKKEKKARYTLQKSWINTVDFVESRMLPKPATNRQQSQLLNAAFGNKSATTSIRQLVAVDFVADTVDFVTSVYRTLK